MSEMMENLKENELPKEIMDFVSGGSQAEIDELYNFYKARGVKMQVDKMNTVIQCLLKDWDLFGNAPGIELTEGKGKNSYGIGHVNKDGSGAFQSMSHKDFLKYLNSCYIAGRGHCGK